MSQKPRKSRIWKKALEKKKDEVAELNEKVIKLTASFNTCKEKANEHSEHEAKESSCEQEDESNEKMKNHTVKSEESAREEAEFESDEGNDEDEEEETDDAFRKFLQQAATLMQKTVKKCRLERGKCRRMLHCKKNGTGVLL